MTTIFYVSRWSKPLYRSYIGPIHIVIDNRQPRIFVSDEFTNIYSYASITRDQVAKILRAWRKELRRKPLCERS